jgi:hypothetical protein
MDEQTKDGVRAEYNGLPVVARTITATVQFVAWVSDDFPDDDAVNLRVAEEIAWAVAYLSVHLSCSEAGDALVAVVNGGSGASAVAVEAHVGPGPTDIDPGVADDVARTEASL